MASQYGGEHSPKSIKGKELLYLNNNNTSKMIDVLRPMFADLTTKTHSEKIFADKLYSTKLLSYENHFEIMQSKDTKHAKLQRIYHEVANHNSWEALIYALEPDNENAIDMILQHVKNTQHGYVKRQRVENVCKQYNQIEETGIGTTIQAGSHTPRDQTSNRDEEQQPILEQSGVPQMQTGLVSTQLTKLYEQVKEKKNWKKLIYSWEEHNHHVIDMLLKYVQDDESTTKALLHVDAEKSAIAEKLMRSHIRRMNIFLPCFLLTVFVIPVIFYIGFGTQREMDIKNQNIPNSVVPTSELPLVLDVNSVDDLNILEGVETVVILNLEDELSSMRKKISLQKSIEYNSVKNLTIAGRVSIGWLEYVIGTFKNLKHFSLDMSQICLGVAIDDPKTYTPLKLENCESFKVLNSKTCYLESWIYRWEFPVLNEITFVNVDVNRRNCHQLNSLVNKHDSNHTSVYFKDCNVYNCQVSLGRKTLITS